jgi:hypothetical protein
LKYIRSLLSKIIKLKGDHVYTFDTWNSVAMGTCIAMMILFLIFSVLFCYYVYRGCYKIDKYTYLFRLKASIYDLNHLVNKVKNKPPPPPLPTQKPKNIMITTVNPSTRVSNVTETLIPYSNRTIVPFATGRPITNTALVPYNPNVNRIVRPYNPNVNTIVRPYNPNVNTIVRPYNTPTYPVNYIGNNPTIIRSTNSVPNNNNLSPNVQNILNQIIPQLTNRNQNVQYL